MRRVALVGLAVLATAACSSGETTSSTTAASTTSTTSTTTTTTPEGDTTTSTSTAVAGATTETTAAPPTFSCPATVDGSVTEHNEDATGLHDAFVPGMPSGAVVCRYRPLADGAAQEPQKAV